MDAVYNWRGNLKSIFLSNAGELGRAILLVLYSWGTELQYREKSISSTLSWHPICKIYAAAWIHFWQALTYEL